VTKSDLEARPVYLFREDRIQAHFLICFIALTLVRVLERKLGGKFAASRVIDSLRKISCSYLGEDWYLFDYADDVTDEISKMMGIPLGKKYLRLGEIKKILGATKKT
jgi:transposase